MIISPSLDAVVLPPGYGCREIRYSPSRVPQAAGCLGLIGFITKTIAPINFDLAEQRDGVLGIMIIAGTDQKSKRIA